MGEAYLVPGSLKDIMYDGTSVRQYKTGQSSVTFICNTHTQSSPVYLTTIGISFACTFVDCSVTSVYAIGSAPAVAVGDTFRLALGASKLLDNNQSGSGSAMYLVLSTDGLNMYTTGGRSNWDNTEYLL